MKDEYKEYPTCPHCGHEHKERTYEFGITGAYSCDKCGKNFKLSIKMTPSYLTSIID